MLFLFGTNTRIEPLGEICDVCCPQCGLPVCLSLNRSYDYLHVFFLPVCKYRIRYFAVCSGCAATFSLDAEIGAKIVKGEHPPIPPDALQPLHKGVRTCPTCGAAARSGNFCSSCGAKL